MEEQFTLTLEGGRPWGFTLQGGTDFRSPLRVGKVTPGGRAEQAGLVAGDFLLAINERPCDSLKHMQAQQLIINSPPTLELACTKEHPVLASPRAKSSSFSFKTPSPYANGVRSPRRTTFSSPRATAGPIMRPKPPPVVWSSPAAKSTPAKEPVPVPEPNGPPVEEEPKQEEVEPKQEEAEPKQEEAEPKQEEVEPKEEEGPSVEVLKVQLEGIEGVSVNVPQEQDNGETQGDHTDVGNDGGKADWVMVEVPPPDEFREFQTSAADETASGQEESAKVPQPRVSRSPPPVLTHDEEASITKKEPGWYKQMFQGLQTFQQAVDQTFPRASPTKPTEKELPKEAPEPSYGYDHRGLRVRSGSTSSSGEKAPAKEEEQPTMRPRAATTAMTKEEVMSAMKRSNTSRSSMTDVGGRKKDSQDYWKKIEKDGIQQDRERRRSQEIRRARSEKMAGHTSPEHYTTKAMHPLLRDAAAEEESTPPTQEGETKEDVFTRIDASKLHGAMENAVMLGKLEQEGVPSALLPSVAQTKQASPEPQKKDKPVKPPPGEKGRALFNFDSQHSKELSFKKGDIITLTQSIDDNWLEGAIDGRKGIFPTNYIKVLSPEELRALFTPEEDKPKMYAIALYDFEAQNKRELSFSKGEVVSISRQIDANWYEGCYGDQKGIFPVAYVQIVEEGSE